MRTRLPWFGVAILLAACSKSPRHDDAPPVAQSKADQQQRPALDPNRPDPNRPKVVLSGPRGDITVTVELADTDEKITRGLMYRRYLAPDEGMLFLMGEEKVQTFWMRNTLIPLDMIFITKDMVVAGVVAQAEPRTDTLRSVDKPSSYVLEVNGGWAAAHDIREGTQVRFDGVVR